MAEYSFFLFLYRIYDIMLNSCARDTRNEHYDSMRFDIGILLIRVTDNNRLSMKNLIEFNKFFIFSTTIKLFFIFVILLKSFLINVLISEIISYI